MAGGGLRVSEVAALKIEHLDGPGGYLHVVDGKGGKQRTKPVLEALEAHLQGRAGGDVFEGRGHGHISTRQIQRLLNEATEKAGLSGNQVWQNKAEKKDYTASFEAQFQSVVT